MNPPGHERPLAKLFVDIASSHQLEAKVIDTPANGGGSERAAAWARLPGTGRKPPIVLLSHLDVVPADPSQWAVAPFGGAVGGGYVVGRGALDAKGVGVVQLLTLIELAQRPVPLDRDVIFLATPDEESGGREGAGWLVAQRPDLLRDAEFLLTEGGGILEGHGDRPPIWGISIAEKTPCWLKVVATGTPGHSSSPPPDAAVPRLIAALDRVRRFESGVRVVPEVEQMFAALAPYAEPEDREGYRDLRYTMAVDPTFRARFLAERGRAALVRDTATITVLEGSPRTNQLPAEAMAHIDARLLPGESCDAFADEIRGLVGDTGVSIEPILSFPSRSSPVDTALFDAIRSVAGEVDPGAAVVPRMIGGFTDAHWFREQGIVAYGFVPRWQTPEETRAIHGPNERISIENLERGVRTMVRILERLDGSPAPGPLPASRGAQ